MERGVLRYFRQGSGTVRLLHALSITAFKDIRSGFFSYNVVDAQVKKMKQAGYIVGNLDATIIAQKPKLSPHKVQVGRSGAACAARTVFH